tara:strand:- start:11022 stop:11498 length:477 start_codon:yes stop_codon:yes gene_type:complete
MSKGRKKKPTQLKKIQGTLRKYREVENEMQVDLCEIIPDPPIWLSKIGKSEWEKVTNQLFNLQMLHVVDLKMVEAYCNEMSLYIECEQALREGGRIDEFFNAEGDVVRRQAKPLIKMKNDALANALKLAVNFGITPSARANISAPVTTNNTQINNYFD